MTVSADLGRQDLDRSQARPAGAQRCPNCGALGLTVFYELRQAPVNSVMLLPDRQRALAFPTGDVALGYCETCDFICNTRFDPRLTEYGESYESSQGYSETFNAFHTALAKSLIDRYDLHGREIIEIGCGHGEFLALLCELGDNRGVGFDPAYLPGRIPASAAERITFVRDFYSERMAAHRADFVCCKMTLEHIPDTAAFIATVRRTLAAQPDTTVFFQVPNMDYVLKEDAFWDVYYEHCSYFSPRALAHLFRACGFEVLGMRTEYDDQYLMIEARPGTGPAPAPSAAEPPVNRGRLSAPVARFAEQCGRRIEAWRQRLDELRRQGRRVVVWGGGSKAVTFLTTLQAGDAVGCVVDINPHKQGCFLAGSGHAVVAPEVLKEYRPNVAIVVNPIYCAEIRRRLDAMGLTVELLPITAVG